MNPNFESDGPSKNCVNDDKIQVERSAELKKIEESDQKDRAGFFNFSDEQMFAMANHDVERRKRVAELFGEGCLKTAADFANAALVFQHGVVPDHFYQAYIWAKRALELGDIHQKESIANAIDRYLVNVGQKQLFASQAHAPNSGKCYCLQPVETSFAEAKRVEWKGRGLSEAYEWVNKINEGKSCPAAEMCKETLAAPTLGQFPGIW